MIEEYQLDKDSIWEFYYFTKEEIQIDPSYQEFAVDQQSRDILQDTFNPPPGLSPSEYSQLFMNHFMKTREKTREHLEENRFRITRYRTLSQLGNSECLRDLENIEKSPNFKSWENEAMVSYFRELSKQYL